MMQREIRNSLGCWMEVEKKMEAEFCMGKTQYGFEVLHYFQIKKILTENITPY